MIDQLAELNRVLLIIKYLGDGMRSIDCDTVIQECQRIAIEGKMPDHSKSIEFANHIGFLLIKGKRRVILNRNGETFLNFNPKELFDLTDKQKKYLLRVCFFDGVFQRETKECLKCFEMSDVKETFTWSEIDGKPLEAFNWIVLYLEQLGLIWRRRRNLIVRKEYVSTVAEFISEPKGWTEGQYFQYMKEKKELGNIAENVICEWEIKRLKKSGYFVEAHCVKKISKLDVAAGYDIKSFDGKSKGMQFDRFIEVKGSKGPGIRFFWSDNEMKVAKVLGEKYWIYYQGGVNVKTKSAIYEPILYQNPLVSLKEDSRLTIMETGAIVEGKIRARKL